MALTPELVDTLQRASTQAQDSQPIAKIGCCKVCGEPAMLRSELCAHHSSLALSHEQMRERALSIIKGNVEEYAKLHLEAARTAVLRGSGLPMEWALLHAKVVEPVILRPETGHVGVTVNVGVLLPGCGAITVTPDDS